MLRNPQSQRLAACSPDRHHPRMTDISQLEKLAEGREAEIFAWNDGAVLKLFRGAAWQRSAEVQAAAMRAVRDGGGPAPRFDEMVEIDGRPGIVMERIEGADMLTILGRKPWTVFSVGGAMGRTHAALHAVAAPTTLPDLVGALRRSVSSHERVPDELRAGVLARLGALPAGERLLHGDFHPGNIMSTASGPIVLDWPNATRGDPMADVARTTLTIRMGELPPGSSVVVRLFDRAARGIILRNYRAAYSSVAPFDDAAVDRWMAPVMAHRLTDGIPEERRKLIALLRERLASGG
jgi:aminoglycoside phosphotransferase (APT) family kinase protein